MAYLWQNISNFFKKIFIFKKKIKKLGSLSGMVLPLRR